MITPFKNINDYIFDLDGTIWTLKELLPNAERVISKIERKDVRYQFITNNTIFTREEIASRLKKMGIRTKEEDIFTSGYVAAKFFEEKGINDFYVIGEHGLLKELDNHGISTTQNPTNILIGIDRNFSYSKLKTAAELVNNGAELYCTGFSKYFRVGNELYPGEAPIIHALKTLTGKMPISLAKPSDIFKQTLIEELTLYGENTLLVGDDLNEDIVLANSCGFKSALILTGNTTKEQAEAEVSGMKKPGAIIRDLKQILSFY